MKSICLIGQITYDTLNFPEFSKGEHEGGITYAANFYKYFGNVTVFTPTSCPNTITRLRRIHTSIDWNFIPTKTRTQLTLEQHEVSSERVIRIRSLAGTMQKSDIKWKKFHLIHIGPQVRGDISLTVFDHLNTSRQRWSIDLQGLTRSRKLGPLSSTSSFDRLGRYIRNATYVKASTEEALWATQTTRLQDAASKILGLGCKEVLITQGARGASIFTTNGHLHVASPRAPRVIDTTGCGEIFFAAYCLARISDTTLEQALDAATRAVQFKLRHIGPSLRWRALLANRGGSGNLHS